MQEAVVKRFWRGNRDPKAEDAVSIAACQVRVNPLGVDREKVGSQLLGTGVQAGRVHLAVASESAENSA
jgi:hypothetical protein